MPKCGYLRRGACRSPSIYEVLHLQNFPGVRPSTTGADGVDRRGAAGQEEEGCEGQPTAPGILDHPSGKKQARLLGFKVNGKACQKPIPGLYHDVDAAVAAQANAQQRLEQGGPEFVWPKWAAATTAERNSRGMVRCVLHCHLAFLLLAQLVSLPVCVCVCVCLHRCRAQSVSRIGLRSVRTAQ